MLMTSEAAAATGFSALEWLVIALAERDRPSSLGNPGRIAAALHRLFGSNGAKSRLANPRLEALRRFAVLAWHHGGVVARSDRSAFVEAGFSLEQAEVLLENIIRRRGGRRVGASA
ncbi:hypothetical protein [Sphingomonas nostoxanthinifaciens]|uniref:hypothetical protein n=1 Tax=Sphingomonas nostoxanthinifaciens TaxID=2872652 RepID=UPI001CC1C3BD|nr:hypothetical protein [Sphingomonas nostoxanthinifaciens]